MQTYNERIDIIRDVVAEVQDGNLEELDFNNNREIDNDE